jgi:hypothetical protein
MAEEVKVEKKDEDWMQKKWRPAMGWMYMMICTLDMGIFPVLWSILQTVQGQAITQWQPLTLQGAGLFHLAMGAVLGIAAFGRTQEKIAGSASNASTTQPTTPSFIAPVGTPTPAATFTASPSVSAFTAGPVTAGFGGKASPPPAYQPEL